MRAGAPARPRAGPTQRLTRANRALQDFTGYGGHVKGCVNLPSDRFYPDSAADKVVSALLKSAPKRVVFHCMLSQQRGPFAAGRFAARLGAAASPATAVLPEVLVLQGGWKAWRRAYGTDASLTEGAE